MKTASYSALRLQPTAKPVAIHPEQAPNRVDTWAPDQRPKKDALVGPRFEQTDLSTQVSLRHSSSISINSSSFLLVIA